MSERRLAAIMFTDIVGYTALMGSNEDKAFEVLAKNREIHSKLVAQFNGTLVKEMGDGMLISFNLASDAVRCAIEIQKACKQQDIPLKIGIHEGEMVFEGADVLGDGVNIASRIQEDTEGGCIMISGSVYRDIKNKTGIMTEFLEEKTYKNVDEPVKVYKVVWGESEDIKVDTEPHPQPTKPSIAVLPFVNMSNDPDQDYFCDGMTEEIINALSHIANLKVIARTSVFMYKDKKMDIREIGKKLDVEHLLEGSVRKAGNLLRITSQLIKVSDGSHLWSERYDRELKDVFEIQDDISLTIVDKMKLKLIGEEKRKIEKKGTNNIESYNYYLLGKHHLQFWTLENANISISYFKRALEISPSYALAYCGISSAYVQLGSDHGNLTPKEAFPLAKKYISKAMKLDDQRAEFHTTKADIAREYDWDWETSEYHYKKALELNPGYLEAHLGYSFILSLFNRKDECINEINLSIEIDPASYITNLQGGWSYYLIGDCEKAIELLNNAVKIGPNLFLPYSGLGFAYYELGDISKVLEMAIKCETVDAKLPSQLGQSASLYALSGHENKAREILADLLIIKNESDSARLVLPFVYMILNEIDEAFYWLNNAIDEKLKIIIFLKTNWFKKLRSDPRWQEMVDKLGFPK